MSAEFLFSSGYGDVGRGAGLVVMVGRDLFAAIVDAVDNRRALPLFSPFFNAFPSNTVILLGTARNTVKRSGLTVAQRNHAF